MAPVAIPYDEGLRTPISTKTTSTGPEVEVTGESIRLAARSRTYTTQTSGVAPTYLQANMIVLPSRYATDFRLLCQRNPVPCPLLAESKIVGSWSQLKSWVPGVSGDRMAADVDLRRDVPKYMVYRDGVLAKLHCADVLEEWSQDDHVGFLIGCSFSFETALTAQGLVPAHVVHDRNVPMYRTKIPLCPAGVFRGATYVVSMRPYRRSEVERVRDITRPYVATHGEPIDWGWHAVERLGIEDLSKPEYGDCPVAIDGLPFHRVQPTESDGEDDLVPVFWGCGVTPQEAIRQVGLEGTVIGHAPGHMLLLDIRDWDIIPQDIAV